MQTELSLRNNDYSSQEGLNGWSSGNLESAIHPAAAAITYLGEEIINQQEGIIYYREKVISDRMGTISLDDNWRFTCRTKKKKKLVVRKRRKLS